MASTSADPTETNTPAEEAAQAATTESYPKPGGHIGLALPLLTVGDEVQVIGRDYSTIGLAPGITVKLDPHWAVDFEFVAYSNFHKNGNFTSIVIDPGVVYNFGPLAAGLRAAMHVGGGQTQNFGLIPIVVKAFPLGSGKVSAFVELDLPVFFNQDGAALTVQPQAGFAF